MRDRDRPGARTKASSSEGVRAEDVVRWGPHWGRRVGQFLDHVVWSTKVTGAEKVPRTGAVILAANHTGVIDGPVLHGASPRGCHILVKAEMFRGPIGKVLTYSGQIPVDRRNGRAALKAALALLQEGRVVAIFPEGTRGTGAVATAQAGVAFLAVHSSAPVVPVAILGSRPTGKGVGHVPRPRHRLHVVFGEPFPAVEGDVGTGREALQTAMERIQSRLSAHVDAAAGQTGVGLPEEVGNVSAEEATSRGHHRAPGEEGRWAGHEIVVTRRLAAPPEAVWTVLTDLEHAQENLRAVTRVEVLTPGEYGVGTRWRETRQMWGRKETEEMSVTASEAPSRTVVEARPGKTGYTTTFTLRPAGSGTQLDLRFTARTPEPTLVERILWRVLGPLGAVATRRALEKDLADIAEVSRKRAEAR